MPELRKCTVIELSKADLALIGSGLTVTVKMGFEPGVRTEVLELRLDNASRVGGGDLVPSPMNVYGERADLGAPNVPARTRSVDSLGQVAADVLRAPAAPRRLSDGAPVNSLTEAEAAAAKARRIILSAEEFNAGGHLPVMGSGS